MGDCFVTYIVFSQEPRGCPSHERLAANAQRFFATALELVEQSEASLVVRVVSSRPPLRGEFRLTARDATRTDVAHALDAEARGRAAGMGALAEKCGSVWTIEAAGPEVPAETVYLTLAAICASVALGPVMPPDASTLFGVRGAIERRDRALAKG
jgi:hypothetical protein